MDQYINILWTCFDAVYDWCIQSYAAFDLDFNSIIIGMLCVSLIIAYILSPYLHNPVPSASTIRDRENAREDRDRPSCSSGTLRATSFPHFCLSSSHV